MKRLIWGVSVVVLAAILLIVCGRDLSIDTSLFTIEVIDSIRHVHNHATQLGDTPGVKRKLLGKIGKLEGKEEEDILYDPVDAARLSNGNILILERSGCRVRSCTRDHEYVFLLRIKRSGAR